MKGSLLRAMVLVLAVSPVDSVVAQATGANPHGVLPEGLSCTSCHTTDAWSPLREDLAFDHSDDTGFPLDGRHEQATCARCHVALVFDQVEVQASDCASCHVDVHLGTLTQPCAACHSAESFSDLQLGVVHPADFPLEGAHLQTTCESCHIDDLGGAFTPLDRECVTCHLSEYVSVPLVDHEQLGFSMDCTECHSTLDFRDVAFDHFTISAGFELVGRHAAVECTECHSLPDGGLPVIPMGPDDCVACHLEDYEKEHSGSGFPTDCRVCHNPNDWDAADFDHTTVAGFELIPNHDQLLCMECHVGSTSATLFNPASPQDCIACHLADYQAEHTGTGFPDACTECHQITTWSGATFDHAFQIDQGPHAAPDCVECHVVPGDFNTFTCLTCHQKPQMDDTHSGESGYAYDSPTCLSCHPTGRKG